MAGRLLSGENVNNIAPDLRHLDLLEGIEVGIIALYLHVTDNSSADYLPDAQQRLDQFAHGVGRVIAYNVRRLAAQGERT